MRKGTYMKNKKTNLIILFAVIIIIIFTFINGYNNLVTLNEDVDNKLSDIETQLQRRNDLIPNLVETVKGFAAHEKEVLKNVSDARAKLAGASNAQELIQGDAELSSALSRLLVVVENYPELKADANFRQLSDELAGTENRIAVARQDYNNISKKYNSSIRRFPSNIIAGIFGFEKVEYFKADEGAKDAPEVDFSE